MSPVQFIFAGATNPEGRSNTSGQRIFRRWPVAASSWNPEVDHIGYAGSVTEKWYYMTHSGFKAKITHLAKAMTSSGRLMKTIVILNSRERCKNLYDYLLKKQWPVTLYHKTLGVKRRMLEIDTFCRSPRHHILLGTDAAGRGLDLFGVEHVVNFDFPDNAQKYLHRSGRTGRAGSVGLVTNIVTPEDAVLAATIRQLQDKGLPLAPAFSRKRSLNRRIDQELTSSTIQANTSFSKAAAHHLYPGPKLSLSLRAKAKLWKQHRRRIEQENQVDGALLPLSATRLGKLQRVMSTWQTRDKIMAAKQQQHHTQPKPRASFPKPLPITKNVAPSDLQEALVGVIADPVAAASRPGEDAKADPIRANYQSSTVVSRCRSAPGPQTLMDPDSCTDGDAAWEELVYTTGAAEGGSPLSPGEPNHHRVSMAAAPVPSPPQRAGGLRRGRDSLAGLGHRYLRDLDDLDVLLG